MFLDHIKTMATHNLWVNARLYDACTSLSDADR